MVCLAPRALEEIVRPRRLSGVVVRPLNFTVRHLTESHVEPAVLNPVAGRRTGLLWIHILCSGVASFGMLSQANFPTSIIFASRWSATAWSSVLPVVWPYIFSFFTSRNVVTLRHTYFVLYSGLVVILTGIVVWLVAFALADSLSIGRVFLVSLGQALACVYALGLIQEHNSKREMPNNRWRVP